MIQGGEDFFKDSTDDFSSGAKRSLRGFATEKSDNLENLFMLILGRKPSSRESAYYKYAALEERDIIKKLLESQEHSKILESASKLPGIQDQLRNLEITEKKLIQKIEDLEKEIAEGRILLEEKNSTIKELREEVMNPYNLSDHTKKYEEGFDVYTPVKKSNHTLDTQRASFRETVREILDMLFK